MPAITISQSPTIAGITNNGPVAAGTPVTLTVTASNPSGLTGPLTYEFDFKDDGDFEVTNATGVASWTYETPGLHVLDVRVVDSQGDKADALTFVVVTTPAPTVTPPANEPAVEGTTAQFDLGQFSQIGGDRAVERDGRLGRPLDLDVRRDDGRRPRVAAAPVLEVRRRPGDRHRQRRHPVGLGHVRRRRVRRRADRDGPLRPAGH